MFFFLILRQTCPWPLDSSCSVGCARYFTSPKSFTGGTPYIIICQPSESRYESTRFDNDSCIKLYLMNVLVGWLNIYYGSCAICLRKGKKKEKRFAWRYAYTQFLSVPESSKIYCYVTNTSYEENDVSADVIFFITSVRISGPSEK